VRRTRRKENENDSDLSNRCEPYNTLLDAMKQINERTFSLVEYFDQNTEIRFPAN